MTDEIPRRFSYVCNDKGVFSLKREYFCTLNPPRPDTLILSPYPEVTFDFNFVVDDSISAGILIEVIKELNEPLIVKETVDLFDVYKGEKIPEGKKSLAVRVCLQPTQATLTRVEIVAIYEKIVAAVAQATGGTLRFYDEVIKDSPQKGIRIIGGGRSRIDAVPFTEENLERRVAALSKIIKDFPELKGGEITHVIVTKGKEQ